MRIVMLVLCAGLFPGLSLAGDDNPLLYNFELTLTRSELDNLTLGDDPGQDELLVEEYELAFYVEYQANDQLFYYFGGSLIDENEKIDPTGERETVSGFERGEMGVGYNFGAAVESEIRVGRREFVSSSDWWYWWDENLDSISLESRFGPYEALLAIAEEQGREVSDMDRIDPELEGVRRLLASFDWEFADGQLLQFYYLDQEDDSASYQDGQSLEVDKIDDTDADLTWTGINYQGWFERKNLGEFNIELAWARVSGRETVYDFDDPAAGLADVDETTRQRISGDAFGARLAWTPSAFDDFKLILAHARGSGDKTADDGKDGAFRQTGLQGDSEIYGELYQPELSNLLVDTLGVEYSLDFVDIALFRHVYRQDEVADEMRDVAIDADTAGNSRSLGDEIDLVLTFDVYDVEVEVIFAEFEAGSAYGTLNDETSRFWQIELTYLF